MLQLCKASCLLPWPDFDVHVLGVRTTQSVSCVITIIKDYNTYNM